MVGTRAMAPWHFWLVGILALLFNAIGPFDFIMAQTQGPAYLASAGMTPEQIAHYQNMPGWMTVVWAIGVFFAFAAAVLLLLRRGIAAPLFLISLAAFLLSLVYAYLLSDGAAVMGTQMAITNAVIAAQLIFLCWYSARMRKRGVLS